MLDVCMQQHNENGHLRFQKSPDSLSLSSRPKPTVLLHQWSFYSHRGGESSPDPASGSTNLPLCCNSEVLPACPRASADPKHPPQHPQPHFAPPHCPGCGAPSPSLGGSSEHHYSSTRVQHPGHNTAWELLDEFSSMWKSFHFDLCYPLTGIRNLQFFYSFKGWNKYWRRIKHFSLICCAYPLFPSHILEHSQHCLASGCIQQKALGAH